MLLDVSFLIYSIYKKIYFVNEKAKIRYKYIRFKKFSFRLLHITYNLFV